MSHQVTVEQLEQQVMQLSPQEQLKLVMYIPERLSAMPLVPIVRDEESLRRQREKETDELLALCDAAAEMWETTSDTMEWLGTAANTCLVTMLTHGARL